jgi:hypothetical protein
MPLGCIVQPVAKLLQLSLMHIAHGENRISRRAVCAAVSSGASAPCYHDSEGWWRLWHMYISDGRADFLPACKWVVPLCWRPFLPLHNCLLGFVWFSLHPLYGATLAVCTV